MQRISSDAATMDSRRRNGFDLPDSLRLPRMSPALEAFGLRARAREVNGGIELEIDGRRTHLPTAPDAAGGECQVWPFAAVRGAGESREMLFAAPDQPVVALIREHAAPTAMRVSDAPFALSIVPLGAARHAIVAHDASTDPPHLPSLVAAATARARRRAAQRPVLRTDAPQEDVFAIAEHDLRRQLRRVAPGVVALTGASPREHACAVLALYALNEAALADELLRSMPQDGAAAALAIGASAAWRGTLPDAAPARSAALEWLRSAGMADAQGQDEWHDAALALAPATAEALGALDIAEQLRARRQPPVATVLQRLANAAHETPAGRVLHAMHATVGIAPDAARGRVAIHPLGIAPRIEFDQIAVGDGTLAYRAHVDAERAILEVEQTAGGSPLTVLLEPRVPGRRLRSARVDDTPAELDAVPEESELRVKVQLVADRPRRLELHYER